MSRYIRDEVITIKLLHRKQFKQVDPLKLHFTFLENAALYKETTLQAFFMQRENLIEHNLL